MITELTIQNFKAISSSVTIPLCPFNVIIGRNASGKSSAIEALSWMSDCVTLGAEEATRPFKRIEDLVYGNQNCFKLEVSFDPQDLSVGNLVKYEIEVSNKDKKPIISSEFLKYGAEQQWKNRITTGDNGRVYELALTSQISQKDRELLRKRAQGNAADKPIESVLYALDSLEAQEFAASSNEDEMLLKLVNSKADRGGSLLRDALEGLVILRLIPKLIGSFSDVSRSSASKKLLDEQGIGVARLLSELDNETLDILIEKVGFIIGRTQKCNVHIPHGPADRRYFGFNERNGKESKEIPGWMLSEGVLRITAILALLLHDSPPSILCIEEIENGLDPWTIQFLLGELSAASLMGTQIIITTHSPYLLNFVPVEHIILVDRSNEAVSFTSGTQIKGLTQIFDHMGAGDMYTARYLHDKSKEINK